MTAKIKWGCTLIVISLAGVWYAVGGFSRISSESNARNKYLKSREGPPNSAAFIAAGISYGMTSDEVDALFTGRACYRSVNMPLADSDDDQGNVNLYIWRHGSGRISYIGKKSTNYYEEWFFVRFDEEGRAISLTRTIANVSDPHIPSSICIDLKQLNGQQ
jgi:hypothetical protein